ncbi:histidine phosphatase superfamily [Paraphoma chrysanthemicola]|uniref:Histidine phosphatase superfamily n=1 Tax=Paraphoma chrysanthemicola TaxID=798071 RepID=A0A8K0RBD4_9PLEO|nr:histidine phosphatase superfamily [Paraphoma chrysanthemicola]
MARSMRLFLIRHGETVDNVAGLYAGIRDSELTNHGYQQATRLGQHFKAIGLSFTHLYSSHLQRAAKTAGKIREGQLASSSSDPLPASIPDVVQLPLLVEQDFGSMEGKKFYERPPESKLTGKEHHRLESKGSPGFVDVESKDSMANRADTFLDEHLLPLLADHSGVAERCIAIVSHGIFLSTLWKRLLLRLPGKSVVLSPELQATARPSLEHLGGWSNTGYLELLMTRPVVPVIAMAADAPSPSITAPFPLPAEMPAAGHQVLLEDTVPVSGTVSKTPEEQPAEVSRQDPEIELPVLISRVAHGWETTILAINSKDHLKGLKRTGGGVGSSRHDASQKSIDTFFKRRKVA